MACGQSEPRIQLSRSPCCLTCELIRAFYGWGATSKRGGCSSVFSSQKDGKEERKRWTSTGPSHAVLEAPTPEGKTQSMSPNIPAPIRVTPGDGAGERFWPSIWFQSMEAGRSLEPTRETLTGQSSGTRCPKTQRTLIPGGPYKSVREGGSQRGGCWAQPCRRRPANPRWTLQSYVCRLIHNQLGKAVVAAAFPSGCLGRPPRDLSSPSQVYH